MNTNKSNNIFSDYGEYLYFTRPFSTYQKTRLFDSLSVSEKDGLLKSYEKDGWKDLIEANSLDKKLDYIKSQFNKDLIEMRLKINKGSPVRVKENFWKFVEKELDSISKSSKYFITGKISLVKDPKDSRWVIIKKGVNNE